MIPPRQRAPAAPGGLGRPALAALLLLLAFAPLLRGGNRHVAMIVLELAAVACLAAMALTGRAAAAATWPAAADAAPQGWLHRALLALLLLGPLWLALVYLVPLPARWWDALPGRAGYAPLLAAAGIEAGAWRPLSLLPDATRASLLAGLPLLAAFLAGHRASLRELRLALRLLLALALAQVLLGLLQIGSPAGAFLYFGAPEGRPVGTFANPNHLANYLAMALAAATWLAWTRLSAGGGRHAASRLRAQLLWGAAVVALLAGLLMTRSRGAALAGLPAAMAALALALGLGLRAGSWPRALLVLATVAAALALVGLNLVLSRLGLDDLSASAAARMLLAASTLEGAAQFWPWGAGWGTYAGVYPRFQPAEVIGLVDYAHHDYAQLLFEGGAPAAVLAAAFAALAAMQAGRLLRAAVRRGQLAAEEMAAALCGLGLLGFLLHSLVEFNMHIPANALTAALLAGVYLRPLSPAAATA